MSQPEEINSQNGKQMLSARAVAKRLNCDPDYVGKLCREGKLQGERVGGAWFVSEESVRGYKEARELARQVRSESLSTLRRQENEHYRRLNGVSTPPALKRFFYSIPFAAGVFALCTALVFAGVQSSPYMSAGHAAYAEEDLAAALAQVESPFFGTVPVPLDVASRAALAAKNAFDSILAFLFGGRSSNIAEAPTPQEPPPQAPVTPPAQTVVNNTYPTVERVVTETASGNWVSMDILTVILGEFRTELTRIIGESIGISLEHLDTGGGGGGLSLSDLTDANIPNDLTLDNYLPLAGGTLTGQLISTSGATTTFAQGINITDGCFAIDGVCISGGAPSTLDGSGAANLFAYWIDGDTLAATSSPTAGYFVATSTTASIFPYASTTAITAETASTTNLIVSSLGPSAGQCLTVNSSGTVTTTTCGSGSSFPFTPTDYGVATSTTIGFTNGLLSTASSTFTSSLRLPSLAAGGLSVDSSGLVYSAATTTFSSGLTYANGNVALDWMFPSNATSTTLTFSGGIFSTASSTITALTTINSTSTNATTTNFAISGITSSLLKTNGDGSVVAAVAGTDYL
ncbi:MAG: helix-turn-helix domain-containing protein, partial [Patescibacteria group bacterium]|nr:helix-turn-helix domain-containing protein [Patescibacteria group bacterium]